ncbi:hypothetical protein NBO_20g0018 [Nosema bombycis CQ1]|uniref:Uncharacterized protein n=1 Tax=Nosema bombycis (strain CQ1 / CVCC 102059) TaxID=578461 RepID=R0MK62_NOSB1|nr:hypothetical protein NBO_20g0018 [Nosema bombycis CQ1]|eukprot:EOB14630.1 hypothetical protein NBO_20g0018 [Nosema bombycis CQ1]
MQSLICLVFMRVNLCNTILFLIYARIVCFLFMRSLIYCFSFMQSLIYWFLCDCVPYIFPLIHYPHYH